MSSDLSSKRTTGRRRYGLALLITFGVTTLFVGGQLYGMVVGVIVLTAFRFLGVSGGLGADATTLELTVLSVTATLAVGILVYGLLGIMKQPFLEYLHLKPYPKWLPLIAKTSGLFVAYLLSVFVLFNLLDGLLPSFDADQRQQLGFDSPSGSEYVLVFIALVLLPPLIEEIVFRGLLYRLLREKAGVLFAALVTSIVFGAAHLEFFSLNSAPLNFAAAADTALFSLFLIRAYTTTNSLWASIALHAMKNALAFFALFVFTDQFMG